MWQSSSSKHRVWALFHKRLLFSAPPKIKEKLSWWHRFHKHIKPELLWFSSYLFLFILLFNLFIWTWNRGNEDAAVAVLYVIKAVQQYIGSVFITKHIILCIPLCDFRFNIFGLLLSLKKITRNNISVYSHVQKREQK